MSHVILVAFTVDIDTRTDAEKWLRLKMPAVDETIQNWWVAEDDRTGSSDNDSAVFVTKGKQPIASSILWNEGLTALGNIVTRREEKS